VADRIDSRIPHYHSPNILDDLFHGTDQTSERAFIVGLAPAIYSSHEFVKANDSLPFV
jgi:hypothetical protein